VLPGAPKSARAVAANERCWPVGLGMAMLLFVRYFTALVVFDAITVMSSSSIVRVGVRETFNSIFNLSTT
jgi:hypothetical protein